MRISFIIALAMLGLSLIFIALTIINLDAAHAGICSTGIGTCKIG